MLCPWPGLAKWASPCPGMIPVCSELGLFGADWKIPQSGWGPCQLLGKMSLQSLRASSPRFLLIQPVGCSALGCRLQAGTLERSPAWPLALPAESPPGAGDGAGQVPGGPEKLGSGIRRPSDPPGIYRKRHGPRADRSTAECLPDRVGAVRRGRSGGEPVTFTKVVCYRL